MLPAHGLPPARVAFFENQVDEALVRRQVLPEIRAELAEIQQALNHANLNEPIVQAIARWYESFIGSLHHPHPTEVIRRFVLLLETILADPLNDDTPYPAAMFGDAPALAVQFIIGKLRNPNSLLYSAAIAAAAPHLPLPPDNYADFADLAALADVAQQINAIFMERQQQEQAALEGYQQMRNQVQRLDEEWQARLQQADNQIQGRFADLRTDVQGLRADLQQEGARMAAAIERLDAEIKVLHQEIPALNADIERLQEDIHHLQRANAQLERDIKQVEKDLKERQRDWMGSLLKLGLSLAATWAISLAFPGASVSILKGGASVGVAWATGSHK